MVKHSISYDDDDDNVDDFTFVYGHGTVSYFLVILVRAHATVKYMRVAGSPKTYGRSWIQPTSVHHWSICTCNNKLMGLLMVASYRATELPYSMRDLLAVYTTRDQQRNQLFARLDLTLN